PADKRIGAVEAADKVVAGEAVDGVVPRRPGQGVVPFGTLDRARTRLARDHYVGRRECRRALQRGDELRCAGTVSIGIVEELRGRRAAERPGARVLARSKTRAGGKACSPGSKVARRAERGERSAVETELVGGRGEVGHLLCVPGARRRGECERLRV